MFYVCLQFLLFMAKVGRYHYGIRLGCESSCESAHGGSKPSFGGGLQTILLTWQTRYHVSDSDAARAATFFMRARAVVGIRDFGPGPDEEIPMLIGLTVLSRMAHPCASTIKYANRKSKAATLRKHKP